MLHSSAELRDRAKQCRDRASEARDPEIKADLLELAAAFEEEAAEVQQKGTFEDGYQDGWQSVAGTDPLPNNPTQPFASEEHTADKGYAYGRRDAKDIDEVD